MTDTAYNRLLKRIVSDPKVLGGEPRIRGTRIHVAVVLDSLAEGLTPAQIIDHYPPLTEDDVRAAVAYAAELTRTVSAARKTKLDHNPSRHLKGVLEAFGYDVDTAFEDGLARSTDREVLHEASEQDRILFTLDTDFLNMKP